MIQIVDFRPQSESQQDFCVRLPDTPVCGKFWLGSDVMWVGIGFALVAGVMWGLVFIGPLLLPEYPAILQSCGRYLAFGLITLPLGWLDRVELARFGRSDWVEAVKLAAIGNLLYYLLLARAIQSAGGPLPTMIIGTLPVVISISANVCNHQRDGRLPWHKLAPSLVVILLGIVCVHHAELGNGILAGAGQWQGILLALGAVVCWTWYPIRNARWLRTNARRSPRAWATAQGLVTLPLALTGYLVCWGWFARSGESVFPMPLGPRPLVFCGLMLAIGLFASWLGTLCWNEASQRLPTALVGQLIVFETLAALLYAFILRGRLPAPLAAIGIGLLVIGVLWATRIRPEH
jgi:drug/metabolite transporter (DMT)-like permease